MQQSLIRLLGRNGWTGLSAEQCRNLRRDTCCVLLLDRVWTVLRRHRYEYQSELHALSEAAIEEIVRRLRTFRPADDLYKSNQRMLNLLRNGVPIRETMPDGRIARITVPVINWQLPDSNAFEVAEGFEVMSTRATHFRVPKLVCLVNGIPLAVIETGNCSGDWSASADAPHPASVFARNQCHDEIPELFAYAQILIAIDPSDARYEASATNGQRWRRWTEEAVCSSGQNGTREVLPRQAHELITGLLRPQRLLLAIQRFVLFNQARGKIVANRRQLACVQALIDRLAGGRRQATGVSVVLHESGTARIEIMAFLVHSLLREAAKSRLRILVVSDTGDLGPTLAGFLEGCTSSISLMVKEPRKSGSEGAVAGDPIKALRYSQERLTITTSQILDRAICGITKAAAGQAVVVVLDEAPDRPLAQLVQQTRHALPDADIIVFSDALAVASRHISFEHGVTPRPHGEVGPGTSGKRHAVRQTSPHYGLQGAVEPASQLPARPERADMDAASMFPGAMEHMHQGPLRNQQGSHPAHTFIATCLDALREASKGRTAGPANSEAMAEEALTMSRVIARAFAQHSLNEHDARAAIWRMLLPQLHQRLGLQQAISVLERLTTDPAARPPLSSKQ